MKKMFKMAACGLAAAMLVTGCSKKAETTETGAEASATIAVETESIVEVVPDGQESVELGEYKGLEYTDFSYEVTDDDVEYEIQTILDANPVIAQVNRAAQEGDIVNIDYVGKLDGVAFDGGTAAGQNLELGSNSYIDGFEDGLIGVEKGQTVNLNLTFPEEYHSAELAGKSVVFEVTVNEVKEQIPSSLSDSFVAQYTQYTTVEELRAGLREEMEAYVAELTETQMKNELYTQILDNAKVTISESQLQEYFDVLYKNYEMQAEYYGVDMDTMAAQYGLDLDTFKAQLTEMAKESAMNQQIFNAIASAEGITIAEQDREDLVAELGYESLEQMIETAGELVVDNYILSEKVMDFLAEHAVAVKAE